MKDRALFAVLAALLEQGQVIDRLSWGITLLAIAALLLVPVAGLPLAGVIAAGLVEAWLGARVAFDARLFAALARGRALPDLAALDGALQRLGLVPVAKLGRPAEARAAGARQLLRWQAAALLLQIGFVALALMR